MNYAVVHMQKFKNHDLKGIQFHNQRERESKSNPDIDKNKIHLNYDLHNPEKIDYNKKVNEIIEKEVITNRKIRKDAVKMCNFIITSDKSFFEKLSQKEQDQFFKKSYEFFKDRYGESKIVSAMVHLDESTPHMHLALVPVIENKLSAKKMFGRKELLAIQEEYPKFIQREGFNLRRGQEGSDREHLTTQEYKKKKIEELDQDIEKKIDEIRRIEIKYNTILNEYETQKNKSSVLNVLLRDKIADVRDLDKKKEEYAKLELLISERSAELKVMAVDLQQMRKTIEDFESSSFSDLEKKLRVENQYLKMKLGSLERKLEKYEPKVDVKVKVDVAHQELDDEDEWDLEY